LLGLFAEHFLHGFCSTTWKPIPNQVIIQRQQVPTAINHSPKVQWVERRVFRIYASGGPNGHHSLSLYMQTPPLLRTQRGKRNFNFCKFLKMQIKSLGFLLENPVEGVVLCRWNILCRVQPNGEFLRFCMTFIPLITFLKDILNFFMVFLWVFTATDKSNQRMR